VIEQEDACVYESLIAVGDWKGLHDRSQMLELDEHDPSANVPSLNFVLNQISNDISASKRQ
jgi:hypothetical protein